MTTIGIDAGTGGAMCYYDHTRGILHVENMPVYAVTINKKKRNRIDEVALLNYFELAAIKGVDRIVMEQQWERPHMSGMFALGLATGLTRMASIVSRIPIDEVPPMTWKYILRVQGGKSADDEAIMRRAEELLPAHREKFRGPRGGRLLDRAEAAMLAYYGETHLAGIHHDNHT